MEQLSGIRYKRQKKGIAIIAAISLIIALCFLLGGYVKREESEDCYAAAASWLALPASAEKPADVFFIYPTVISGDEKSCAIDSPEMLAEALKLKDAHSGIFEEANFFAPYYRQLSIAYLQSQGTAEEVSSAIREIPFEDCKNAFRHYLASYNKSRPIIFASHSQGTMVMMQLLLWIKENHPEVLHRTIAAYMVGFAITQDYIDKLGMPFAEKSDDTGVIISYNTEAPDAAPNPFTMGLIKGALAINPISWRRDEAPASKSESKGSRIRPGDAPAGDQPHFADAQVDTSRGTVVTTAPVSSGGFWPKGVLHHYDFDLFYYDLKENVGVRINAFLSRRPKD
jgi:hypothetical protein